MSNQGKLDKLLGWHLMVPPRAGRRVHLQGFPKGSASHWQKNREEIVVEDPSTADIRFFWNPHSQDVQAGPEGCVVVGQIHSIPQLIKKGLTYALLPTAEPRLVLPLHNSAQLQRGLSMHKPGRRTAQWVIAATKILVQFNILAPLKRRVLWISGCDKPNFGDDAILYLGTSDINRKTTILPVEKHTIFKHGANPQSQAALHNEASALCAMAKTHLAGNVPRLVSIVDTQPTTLLKQQYWERRTPTSNQLQSAIVSFLVGMTKIDWKRRVLTEIENEPTVPGHRQHGDFAPWNMIWTKRGLFVFDWEDSVAWAPAYSDAFYFIVAPALYIEKKPQPKKIANDAIRFATHIAHAANLDPADVQICWKIWLQRKHASTPAPLFAQMIELLGKNNE